jgi:hypothetical protein
MPNTRHIRKPYTEKPYSILQDRRLLIEVSASLSNRILRKGDVFTIYVDIHNTSDKPISIVNVKLVSPLGFIQYEKDKMPASVWGRIRGVKIGLTSFEFTAGEFQLKASPTELKIARTPVTVPMIDSEKPVAVTEKDSKKDAVQPSESYRAEFNMQAGRMLGVVPRPDTYTISIEVVYTTDSTAVHRKQISFEISIFPPVIGMLGGTLLGSLLGTTVSRMQSITSSPVNPQLLIPIFLANLILAFIAGVVLMRKKDVQPLVTIEDFWGGLLLGFLVGFGGQALFSRITGITSGGNSTIT